MEFVKESSIPIDKTDKEKKYQLIYTIILTREELNKAHKNFEYAEGDLIDFYTYQIMALQSKLDYLTKVAKIQNIDFNFSYKDLINLTIKDCGWGTPDLVIITMKMLYNFLQKYLKFFKKTLEFILILVYYI